MIEISTRGAVRSLFLALVLIAAGCAATGGGGKDPVAAVKARAAERWQLLLASKPEAAYDYLSKGVRSTQSREQYGAEYRSRPVERTDAQVVDATCDQPDACTVKVKLKFRVKMPTHAVGTLDSEQIVEERWIRDGGEWVHVPKNFL